MSDADRETTQDDAAAAADTTPADVAAAPASEPDDADDLRGYHFRELLHKRLTWILVGAAAVIGAAVGTAFGTPILGAVILVAVLLVALFVIWKIADARAADDFFHVYAKHHNLKLGGKSTLSPATPLLRKGDEQYADRTLVGELAPGIEGMLALYTYVIETTDSRGNRERSYHPFTITIIDVPECVSHVPELYCQRKFGLHMLEKFEDVFRLSKERVKLESEALDDKYEIFTAKGQDENWLRQLFEPTFIVWLTDTAPDHFAFELVDGTLVSYVHGHKEDTADLAQTTAGGATVAERLRDESAESK